MLEDRAHLRPRREPGAAAASEPRRLDLRHDLVGPEGEGVVESGEPALPTIRVERQRTAGGDALQHDRLWRVDLDVRRSALVAARGGRGVALPQAVHARAGGLGLPPALGIEVPGDEARQPLTGPIVEIDVGEVVEGPELASVLHAADDVATRTRCRSSGCGHRRPGVPRPRRPRPCRAPNRRVAPRPRAGRAADFDHARPPRPRHRRIRHGVAPPRATRRRRPRSDRLDGAETTRSHAATTSPSSTTSSAHSS